MQKILVAVALLFTVNTVPTLAQTAKAKPTMPAAVRFAKAGETWGAILSDKKTLAKAVAEGRLSDVHDAVYALRDSAVTLPYKSDGLPPTKKALLNKEIAAVAALADAVHVAADADDLAKTKASFTKLSARLNAVAALFPKDALPTGEARPLTAADKALFLTPGGAYTKADIAANGNTSPAAKYGAVIPSHDTQVKKGDAVCPISETKPNPKLAWIIGGKRYTFCCPPCIGEFLTKAKKTPEAIAPPESYVKM